MRTKKNIYRTVYWNRILIVLATLSIIACGVILYLVFSRTEKASITVEPRAYYYVATGSFNTRSEAVPEGVTLRGMGGAGYILNDGTSFRLTASVYGSESDAQKVAARLTDEGFGAEVYSYKTEKLSLTVETEAADAHTFVSYFSYCHTIFESVYRLNADLDAQKITESYAAFSLEKLRAKLNEKPGELNAFASYPSASNLKMMYGAVSALFSDALGYTFGDRLSTNIKYLLCGISDEYGKCVDFIARP